MGNVKSLSLFAYLLLLSVLGIQASKYVSCPIEEQSIGDQKGPDSLYQSPVTYMIIISEEWLNSQGLEVGDHLTGLSWRFPAFSQAGPFNALHSPSFEVRIAQSRIDCSSTSTKKLSEIMDSDITTCYGPAPLTIPAFSFPGGYAPNDFGYEIKFSKTYVYRGGDLALYLSSVGFGNSLFVEWSTKTTNRVTTYVQDLQADSTEFDLRIANQSPVIRFCVCPVRECGGLRGDPHFVGFDGSKFNFDGESGEVFGILSDAHIQVNGLFTEMTIRDVVGTWVTRVGVMIGSDVRLVFDPIHGLIVNDRNIVSQDIEFPMDHGVQVTLKNKMKRLEIDASLAAGYIVHVTVESVDGSTYLNVGFSIVGIPINPHGIIGQTALYLVTGETPNPQISNKKNAEDILDGTYLDYIVRDGILGNQFEFNRFDRMEPNVNRRSKTGPYSLNESNTNTERDDSGGDYTPSFPFDFKPGTKPTKRATRASLF